MTIANINTKQAKRFAELVAKRIQAEATMKGISARKLTRLIDSDASTLSNYFTGKREMPLSILEKCCQVIGVEPREIVAMAYRDLMREFGNPDSLGLAANRPGYSLEDGYDQ